MNLALDQSPDFRAIGIARVQAARDKMGLDHDRFAGYLAGLVGWDMMPGTVKRWESAVCPPGDVLLAAEWIIQNAPEAPVAPVARLRVVR